jgi:hypothetical protein
MKVTVIQVQRVHFTDRRRIFPSIFLTFMFYVAGSYLTNFPVSVVEAIKKGKQRSILTLAEVRKIPKSSWVNRHLSHNNLQGFMGIKTRRN